MKGQRIDVIATTISGSIEDWGKIKYIEPLFKKYGLDNVSLSIVDSHDMARNKAYECIKSGTRLIISAGGSGTFNSVLEGCCDSGVDLKDITLGFLRKGSADLIGKVLGMPDDIEEAVKVFVNAITNTRIEKCDVILAESEEGKAVSRHFVGYAGAEIFGNIPRFTENKFMKYYKGILSQLFGDLGPFFVGASLATTSKIFNQTIKGRKRWQIFVDGQEAAEGNYQIFVIVNGDLGKDLPWAHDVPLGSGDFYLFAVKDIGILKLVGQFKHAWDSSVLDNPDKWGFESYRIKEELRLKPDRESLFNVNIDGSTMGCVSSVSFHICNQINLLTTQKTT